MFQRDLEQKNAAIEGMLKDLDDSEEQERYAIRVHSEKMDQLIALQQKRIEDLRAAFVAEVKQLKADHELERAEMIASAKTLKTEILHFMRAIREDEEAKLSALEAESAQNKEQQRRRALERIHALQTDMDSAIEILEKAFEEAHARYLSSTDQRTQDFKTLSARGQHDTQMKERQRRAIKRLQMRLQYQQNKLAYLVSEADEKNDALSEERDLLGKQLHGLKQRWAYAQEVSGNRLKALATATQSAKARLGDQLALASRILVAAETIRQLEPAESLVRPFPPVDPSTAAMAGSAAGAGAALMLAMPGSDAGGGGGEMTAAAMLDGGASVTRPGAQHSITDVNLPESPLAAANRKAIVDAAAAAAAAGDEVMAANILASGGSLVSSMASSQKSLAMGADGSLVLLDKSLMERMGDEPDVMSRFYDRMNRALIEKLALEKRVQLLREENDRLHGTLQQCVANVTVESSTVDKPNALLVVNGRTGLPANPRRPLPKGPAASVFVDASRVANTLALQVGGGSAATMAAALRR